MANTVSALKRVRANKKKREKNKYQNKTTKTIVKGLLKTSERKEGVTKEHLSKEFNKAVSMLDKLVKSGIIHANKSARKKSQLARHMNKLLVK